MFRCVPNGNCCPKPDEDEIPFTTFYDGQRGPQATPYAFAFARSSSFVMGSNSGKEGEGGTTDGTSISNVSESQGFDTSLIYDPTKATQGEFWDQDTDCDGNIDDNDVPCQRIHKASGANMEIRPGRGFISVSTLKPYFSVASHVGSQNRSEGDNAFCVSTTPRRGSRLNNGPRTDTVSYPCTSARSTTTTATTSTSLNYAGIPNNNNNAHAQHVSRVPSTSTSSSSSSSSRREKTGGVVGNAGGMKNLWDTQAKLKAASMNMQGYRNIATQLREDVKLSDPDPKPSECSDGNSDKGMVRDTSISVLTRLVEKQEQGRCKPLPEKWRDRIIDATNDA